MHFGGLEPTTLILVRARATIEVALSFRNVFWMTVLLNPESSELAIFYCMILVVCLRHGYCVRYEFFFSKSVFGSGLKLPN